MQRLDAEAIHTVGIPRLLLMEHAGVALARAVTQRMSTLRQPVLICCGTGFNGGDGLAAARHLHAQQVPLRVLVMGTLDRLRDEPATYATILHRLGLPLAEVTDVSSLDRCAPWMADAGLIVDALLGIGATGAVREPMAGLIDRINRSGKPILSADLPSGLDGDTGIPQGIAVKATVTVAFGLPKQGCFLGEGPSYTGQLIVDPITMPEHLLHPALKGGLHVT